MNNPVLNDLLEQFLSQLQQWKNQLMITTIEPTELESILLELHNSLDLLNSYQLDQFDRSHLAVIKEIDKQLTKVSSLVELLNGDLQSNSPNKIDNNFSLYSSMAR